MTSPRGENPREPALTTVYLGRYTWDHANAIAGELEEADIAWWYKQPGFFSQLWEFGGIRLFVDRERLDEARAISDRIAPDGTARPGGRPSEGPQA
jgi:hypothetical protein